MGLVVVKELHERGMATIFINSDGEVELCPPREIELDGLVQEDALGILLDRGYTDDQLLAYLKGRKAREEM